MVGAGHGARGASRVPRQLPEGRGEALTGRRGGGGNLTSPLSGTYKRAALHGALSFLQAAYRSEMLFVDSVVGFETLVARAKSRSCRFSPDRAHGSK